MNHGICDICARYQPIASDDDYCAECRVLVDRVEAMGLSCPETIRLIEAECLCGCDEGTRG